MSPSEFDLRSALRDGEGDVPDVERVLTDAHRHRAQRRARVLSASAAVVVVAGVATGITVVSRHDQHVGDAAPSVSFTRPVPNPESAPPSLAASSASGAVAGRTQPVPVRCPTSFPRTMLPGGGSPGQFGASGPLFARSVSSVIVCSYGTAGPNHDLVLRGSAADSLVRSLEAAAKRPVPIACPAIVVEGRPSLAIIGITPSGKALRAVTTSLNRPTCSRLVTNGTAIRYNWTPPIVLLPTLRPLLPTGAAPISAPPSATGSPIPRPVRGSPVVHGSPLH